MALTVRLKLVGLGLALPFFVAACDEPVPKTEPPPPRVTVEHPQEREIVDYNEYNGWTDASATVEVRSRVRGHIDKVHFTDGEVVDAGKLLFELDPRPFQADIDVAQGQVNVAEAQLEFAIAEEARQQELFDKKSVSDIVVEGVFTRITDDELRAAVDRMTRLALDVAVSDKH